MKSLVEEASSITKAIEKAWIRAGKPQTFSIKIFENPEVGFLGFTKKSAKIGIFFEEVESNTSTQTTQGTHHTQKNNRHKNNERREFRSRSQRSHTVTRKNSSHEQDQKTVKHTDNTHSEKQPRQDRHHQRRSSSQRSHSEQENKRPVKRREPRAPRKSFEKKEVSSSSDINTVAVAEKNSVQEIVKTNPINTSTMTTSAIKKAPKFSGRRFVQQKKEEA